jgi:hypothetical protein
LSAALRLRIGEGQAIEQTPLDAFTGGEGAVVSVSGGAGRIGDGGEAAVATVGAGDVGGVVAVGNGRQIPGGGPTVGGDDAAGPGAGLEETGIPVGVGRPPSGGVLFLEEKAGGGIVALSCYPTPTARAEFDYLRVLFTGSMIPGRRRDDRDAPGGRGDFRLDRLAVDRSSASSRPMGKNRRRTAGKAALSRFCRGASFREGEDRWKRMSFQWSDFAGSPVDPSSENGSPDRAWWLIRNRRKERPLRTVAQRLRELVKFFTNSPCVPPGRV